MKTIQLAAGLEPQKIPKMVNGRRLKKLLEKCAKEDDEEKIILDKTFALGKNIHNIYLLANRLKILTNFLGSSEMVTYPGHNAGLFSTVMECYNHHFSLRTGPEDWWYTIIQTVAVAIDKNAKDPEVRKFFVQHEGKKTLTVEVGPTAYGVDYSWFFDQMAQQIAENINCPQFVDQMDQNFSTSTKVHKIVSRITLMKSMKEYFQYRMSCLCGIPAIEMKGTQEDWTKLGANIKGLRRTLQPIHDAINLKQTWWDNIETIADKLLDTFNENPDKDWWSKIITERAFGSGAPQLKGWFMVHLLNIPYAKYISDAPSGLVTVPMTITDGRNTEQSAIVAGMVGYKFHENDVDARKVYSLEPVHGWSLLIEKFSAFRIDMDNWEENFLEN